MEHKLVFEVFTYFVALNNLITMTDTSNGTGTGGEGTGDGTGTGTGTGEGTGGQGGDDKGQSPEVKAAEERAAKAEKALNELQSAEGRAAKEAADKAVADYQAKMEREKAEKDGDKDKIIETLKADIADRDSKLSNTTATLTQLEEERKSLAEFRDGALGEAKKANEALEKELLESLDGDTKKTAEAMIAGYSEDPMKRRSELQTLKTFIGTKEKENGSYNPNKGGSNLKEGLKKHFGKKDS